MEPLTIIVTLASGILIGWWGHTLNSKLAREAREHAENIAIESRLTALEVFLNAREQLVEVTPTENISNLYYSPSGSLSAGMFRTEAAKVRRDFAGDDRVEFNRLADALSRMPPNILQADEIRTSRYKLADAIRDLLKFVQNA